MKHISTTAFKEVLDAEKNNPTVDFINVCTTVEYKEKHIEGVRSVPLDEIERHIDEFNGKKTIYVHCRSGSRSQKAVSILEELGVEAELVNVGGGLQSWDDAGFQTMSLTKRLPLMRQVMLAAGVLVLLGFVLSVTIHSNFIFLSVFVGAGLAMSGLTGWCGMAIILSKMPWNK